jgi:hypothetical protein
VSGTCLNESSVAVVWSAWSLEHGDRWCFRDMLKRLARRWKLEHGARKHIRAAWE